MDDADKYIALYARLMRSVGVYIADRVISLIRHFWMAPELQIVGYIVNFLKDCLKRKHHAIIFEIVRLKKVLSYRVDHSLAAEIGKKNTMVPSYCLSTDDNECRVCGNSLSF